MSRKLLAVMLVMALALFACGDSEPAGPAQTVNVDMTETDSTTMVMTVDPQTVEAGTVTFEVTNSGDLLHEFVIFETDLAADALPTNESGSEVLEDGEGLSLVDEVEDIESGETGSVTVTLEPGNYVLVCNIKGHYQMGLRAELTVTE